MLLSRPTLFPPSTAAGPCGRLHASPPEMQPNATPHCTGCLLVRATPVPRPLASVRHRCGSRAARSFDCDGTYAHCGSRFRRAGEGRIRSGAIPLRARHRGWYCVTGLDARQGCDSDGALGRWCVSTQSHMARSYPEDGSRKSALTGTFDRGLERQCVCARAVELLRGRCPCLAHEEAERATCARHGHANRVLVDALEGH